MTENANVVRIMSIHKSKGLEFPVCIIAGCAHATEIAAVLGGVSLTTFLTGIWL